MMVSDEIIKVLDALCKKFELTIDWTSNNILPYLEQLSSKYINYEITTSAIWLVLGVIIGIIALKGFKNLQQGKALFPTFDYFLELDIFIVSYVVLICCVGISVAMILSQVFDIATCLTLPEKVITDELTILYQRLNRN